jgi:hypothetical protein
MGTHIRSVLGFAARADERPHAKPAGTFRFALISHLYDDHV